MKRSFALFGLTTALGAAAALSVAGASRAGALSGVVGAAISSAVALALLTLALPRGLKQVLAAVGVSFLVRMIVVAAGVLVAKATGGNLFAFCIGFFALYLAHQLIEIAAVSRGSETRPLEGKV